MENWWVNLDHIKFDMYQDSKSIFKLKCNAEATLTTEISLGNESNEEEEAVAQLTANDEILLVLCHGGQLYVLANNPPRDSPSKFSRLCLTPKANKCTHGTRCTEEG
jgi:hypothetical protein